MMDELKIRAIVMLSIFIITCCNSSQPYLPSQLGIDNCILQELVCNCSIYAFKYIRNGRIMNCSVRTFDFQSSRIHYQLAEHYFLLNIINSQMFQYTSKFSVYAKEGYVSYGFSTNSRPETRILVYDIRNFMFKVWW